jgi:sarcosine oxidase, subunit gamma
MQQFDIKKIIQTSPAAHTQLEESTQWEIINGMDIAVAFASAEIEQARKKVLGVADVSCLSRYGVKGPNATQWLVGHGISIPTNNNAWTLSEQKTLVLRLGSSEYLIEDQLGGSACSKLETDTARIASVYKVPRADAAFIVSGSEALNLFSEVCSLDLRVKSFAAKEVIMTQVAEISATIIRQTLNGETIYRIWCDGTYGAYMWEVLLEIAHELGGGAVGLSRYQN